MDLQNIRTRPEARIANASIASPGSLASAHDDEILRARFEYLIISQWQDHGARGRWETVCLALHVALMLAGPNNELREDLELLSEIAYSFRFPNKPMLLIAASA